MIIFINNQRKLVRKLKNNDCKTKSYNFNQIKPKRLLKINDNKFLNIKIKKSINNKNKVCSNRFLMKTKTN